MGLKFETPANLQGRAADEKPSGDRHHGEAVSFLFLTTTTTSGVPTMRQTLKTGTRIELHGTPAFPGFPGVAPETATIARWTAANGSRKNHVADLPGWHVVKFGNGRALCVHESRFRVTDNRAA
jgi:hypothetical protein